MALLGRTFCLLFILVVLVPLGTADQKTVEVNDPIIFALFYGRFIDPVETVYCLMNDGMLHAFTNNSPLFVGVSGWFLYDHFKSIGKELKDCVIIIHNHLWISPFSQKDKIVYRSLQKYGFTGRFMLYVTLRDKYYELKD